MPSSRHLWLVVAIVTLNACATFQAMGAAVTNPNALALANDGSPLTVVIQRADAASTTARQVDRLLTSTPVDDDATWVKQANLPEDYATARTVDMSAHPYYMSKKYNIAPALIWAERLSNIQSTGGRYSSLLAAISTELQVGYLQLEAANQKISALALSVQSERHARDNADASVAEKPLHEARVEQLSKALDNAKGELEGRRQTFVAESKAVASTASAAACAQFNEAIESLLRAVREAQTANGAALIRYPFVAVDFVKTLKSQLLDVVKGNVSDYVYERTGKRVQLANFHPDVTFENGHVGITINAIPAEDPSESIFLV